MKETVNFRPALVPHNGRAADCAKVLDALGVPYLIWYADGRFRLSSAAVRLLPEGHVRTTLAAEAAAVARAAVQRAPLPGAGDGLVFDRQVRASAWMLELAVFTSRAGHDSCALVVLLAVQPAGIDRLGGKGLTRREHDVALLIADGHSNKEISRRLALSPHTVRHHTEQVFRKLGVSSRFMVAAMVNRPVGRSSDAALAMEVG